MENHKSVLANVIDPNDDKPLTKIHLEIDRIEPSTPEEKPTFIIIGSISLDKSNIDGHSLLLEISPSFRGYAYFTRTGNSPMVSQYNILLKDSIWREDEWFNNI